MTADSWRSSEAEAAQVMGWVTGYLLQDSLDGRLFVLLLLTVWQVIVLEGHLNEGWEQRKE